MKMRYLVTAVAALLVLLASCTKSSTTTEAPSASPSVTLKVASDTTFPPMEFVDDNKNIVGFDVDLLNEVAKAGGFAVQFSTVSWDGIFASVDNGAFDMIASSVSITDERKEKYDFSDAYVNAGQIISVPVADTTTSKLDDLVGKQVGVQQGTTGDILVSAVKGIKTKGYSDIGLAFQDLANGNLAAVVVDSPTAINYALQNQDLKGKLKFAGEPLDSEPYGYVVKKGNTQVLDLLNKGLAAVKASGKLDELKAKWGLK